jgi:hypothetical protein
MALDQVVLEQQRLGFRCGRSHFDAVDLRDHRHGLRGMRLATREIGADAILQVARLADVQHLAVRRDHAIHAGALAEVGEERLRVERAHARLF